MNRLFRLLMQWKQNLGSRLLFRRKGQGLPLYAAIIAVLVAFLVLGVGVGSILVQARSVGASADAAARAGSQEVSIPGFIGGRLMLDCVQAEATTRAELQRALEALPYDLLPGVTPASIAASAEIHVVNTELGSICSVPPDQAGWWTSPHPPYRTYTRPVVSVYVVVPSKLFFTDLPLKTVREHTVISPGGP